MNDALTQWQVVVVIGGALGLFLLGVIAVGVNRK